MKKHMAVRAIATAVLPLAMGATFAPAAMAAHDGVSLSVVETGPKAKAYGKVKRYLQNTPEANFSELKTSVREGRIQYGIWIRLLPDTVEQKMYSLWGGTPEELYQAFRKDFA